MRHGSAVAQRSPRRESGGLIHSDRRERAQLLRTAFMGVMPYHVHLLILPQVSVAVLMRWLKGSTARSANRILGRTGQPFWQDESFDHYLRSPKQIGADFGLHQGQSGFGGFGPLCGRVAVVQRRMAGGEPFGPACPTRLRKFLRSGGGMLAGGWWRRRNRRAPVHVYDSHLGRLVLHIWPGLHHQHVRSSRIVGGWSGSGCRSAPCGRSDPDQPVRRYQYVWQLRSCGGSLIQFG